MKVSRGKKKIKSSSYNLPVPASWECCRRTGNVCSCSRVLVSFDCIGNSFFGSTLSHLPYVMRSHPVHSKTEKSAARLWLGSSCCSHWVSLGFNEGQTPNCWRFL